MSRKGESITLSLSADEKAELERIALQFGCTWGDKPNVSALLKAVASGRLKVCYSDEDIPMTASQRSDMRLAIATIQEQLAKLNRIV